jgi:hypothetical protein
MRKIVQKLVDRLHAVEDHLTVRTQIAAAVAVMCVVLVGTLAGSAALIGYQNTASQVNSNLVRSLPPPRDGSIASWRSVSLK